MDSDRYKELCAGLSDTLRMQLDNIKGYLNLQLGDHGVGSVSLMIGSGFSKNADRAIDVSMLDWNELGAQFYSKLYGKEPEDKDLKFTSPIKLASMIEAEFGHTVLDEIIQKSLPDERVFPNELYKDMLNLPWHDIFTTNYDRLLENGMKLKGVRRYYQVVTNKDTLIYTPSPRIIKLHGSFPDIRPYIITEEDYRTYLDKHPEYVNTVRQSLIETLFCLIGFSSDDPNFLNWIGWLRDIMGRLAMPVYLITFSHHIHGANVKLLSSRNIEIVNLANINGIKNYSEALSFLFNYLKSHKKRSWDCSIECELKDENSIKDYIAQAEKVRRAYPGWIVIPDDLLIEFENDNIPYQIEKCIKDISDEKLKIRLLFEFDWRLNISLSPKRYDWYQQELEAITLKTDESLEIHQKKIWLLISLLNIYRHKGEIKKYDELKDNIGKEIDDVSDEIRSRYYNEVSLMFLSRLDYDAALGIVQKWNPSSMDYKSRILRASVWDECGKENEALKELKDIRDDIQKQRLAENFSESHYLESCLQQVSSLIRLFNLSFWRFPHKEDEDDDIEGLSTKNIESKLKEKPKETYIQEHSFGIKHHTNTWNLESTDFNVEYLHAYRYLTWLEESGFPFGHYHVNLNKNSMTLAISAITRYEPFFGVGALVRACNNDMQKKVMSRETIKVITREENEAIFNIYGPIIDLRKENNTTRRARIGTCLKILARLASKASQENVMFLLQFMASNMDYFHTSFDENDFSEVYSCLNHDSLNRMLVPLYNMPFTGVKEYEVNFPQLNKNAFKIDDSIVIFLMQELHQGSSFTAEQAFRRIKSLFYCLTEKQKRKLKPAVIAWRNHVPQTVTMLESYHYFPYNIKESINVKEVVNKSIDDLNIAEYKIKGSSEPISRLRIYIARIMSIINIADETHKNMFIDKVCTYLDENDLALKNDDSTDLFGGLRNFASALLHNICGAILNAGINTYSKDALERLYKQLYIYAGHGFYLLYTLSLVAKEIGRLEDIRSMVVERLFAKDSNGLVDALSALVQLQNYAYDDDLVKKIESFVEFVNSDNVAAYINYITTIVKDGIYQLNSGDHASKVKVSANYKRLESMLNNLAVKVKTDYEASTMADIEYEALRLVQQLIQKDPTLKKSEAVKKWKAINEDPETFNDVRLK